MRTTLRNAALLVAILLCVAFVVLLVNQTVQVVGLAGRFHPMLGTVVLWGLILLYAVCVIVPTSMFLRLPKPLVPPPTAQSVEFPEHLAALGRRLRENRSLAGRSLATLGDIEEALRALDTRADAIIQKTGSQLFVATAVSQNGSLDALMVLLAQTRMIWQIAHIYYQRPTPRDLAYLYGNVVSTALVASQLDDIDLSVQAQPLLSAALGSAAGAIPGLHVATTLLVNSIVTGTANAFLALRVGIIAKMYCGALVLPEARTLRRMAAAQAARMLGSIAHEGAKRVANAFWAASKSQTGDAARAVAESAKQAMSALIEKLRFAGREPEGDPTGVRTRSVPPHDC
jgi:uncharacterized membrane protein YcjF (UPF0283 family)